MGTDKRFIGFMVIGKGEGDRWLRQALIDIMWCDEICVCLNFREGEDKKTEKICEERKCRIYYDDRVWGKDQWKIKEDFFNKFVKKFDPTWIIAKDADEIFDKKFGRDQAIELAEKGGTGYQFYVINLYDDGYCKRQSFWNMRMWQYKEEWGSRWQRRNLHCGLYPIHNYRYSNFAPFILLHYGLQSKEDRQRKVERYKKFDPQCRWMRMNESYYKFLESKTEVDKFDEDELHKKAVDYSNKTYFKTGNNMSIQKEKQYEFRRVLDDCMVIVGEDQVDEHKKRMDYKTGLRAFIYIGEVKDRVTSTVNEEVKIVKRDPLQCEICGFKSEDEGGLKIHNKTHE